VRKKSEVDDGILAVEHDFDEIHELGELVEQGPSWYAIEDIVIKHALSDGAHTVEDAAEE
jgi:hypothetical protein